MYGTPKTSALWSPIASEITVKNRILVNIGPSSVWPETVRNLRTSFLNKEYVPTQLIKPNLLVPILYFVLISTIDRLINPNLKKTVQNLSYPQNNNFLCLNDVCKILHNDNNTKYKLNIV